jgi:hypothetical protein
MGGATIAVCPSIWGTAKARNTIGQRRTMESVKAVSGIGQSHNMAIRSRKELGREGKDKCEGLERML